MAAAKSNTGLLWIGVLAFAGYKGYEYYRQLHPGVVEELKTKQSVMQLRIGKIYGVQFKGDTVTFKFPIENPNNDPMIVKAIVGNVFITAPKTGTIKIGQVAHYGTDTIKPVGETNFDLAVKINLLNEFTVVSNLLSGNMKGMQVSFNGTVNANGRTWPVKESVTL